MEKSLPMSTQLKTLRSLAVAFLAGADLSVLSADHIAILIAMTKYNDAVSFSSQASKDVREVLLGELGLSFPFSWEFWELSYPSEGMEIQSNEYWSNLLAEVRREQEQFRLVTEADELERQALKDLARAKALRAKAQK